MISRPKSATKGRFKADPQPPDHPAIAEIALSTLPNAMSKIENRMSYGRAI